MTAILPTIYLYSSDAIISKALEHLVFYSSDIFINLVFYNKVSTRVTKLTSKALQISRKF